MKHRATNDETMERIRTAASKSSAITKEIGTLAYQANLLAFEASAQAARSGTAGREVALAADRVRQIAQRAQDAAWKTSALIDECEVLSRNVESVTRGMEERLTLVISSVDDFSNVVKELMDGVRAQLSGMEQACHQAATASNDRETAAKSLS